MKKKMAMLMTAFLLASGAGVLAAETETGAAGAEAAAEEAAPAVDPAATNRKADYPSPAEALPPLPVPPANGVKDPKAFLAYQQAVNEYLAAAQVYIDGATNDANDIILKRNDAVKNANEVVNAYNAVIDAAAGKK